MGIFLFLIVQEGKSFAECSSVCMDLNDQLNKLESDVSRLEEIKSTNVAYIRTLDSDQDAQRLKASSNIHIAEKRIADANQKKQEIQKIKILQKCKNCKGV